MRRIVEESHAAVTRLLSEHRDQLESLTGALLEHETLDEADAYAAAGVSRNVPATPGGSPALAASDRTPG